ncbi:uncharacterized protein LOC131604620 [Vicia villosa]|uniref:uncharacterized protein LOC131604620 n=1 Tax=Vicia villosa TaxID=3911 RepID=UPI00273CF431|nr:uncharacterized protein LOC131604620 [Vicia villosa]
MSSESSSDDLALLGKQFNKISSKHRLKHERYEQTKRIVYLKKHGRGSSVSWSGEKFKRENKEKSVKQENIMTGACESDEETDNSDTDSYVEELTDEKYKLLSIIDDLKEEIVLLNSDLHNMTQLMRRSSTSSTVTDETLQSEKITNKTINLDSRSPAVMDKYSEIKEVPRRQKQKMSRRVSHHLKISHKRYDSPLHKSLKCYHCSNFGHSKSSCYKLIGYPIHMLSHQGKHTNTNSKAKKAPLHGTCVKTMSRDMSHAMYGKRSKSMKAEGSRGKKDADVMSDNLSNGKLVSSVRKKSEESKVIYHKVQKEKNCHINRSRVIMDFTNMTVSVSIRKENTLKEVETTTTIADGNAAEDASTSDTDTGDSSTNVEVEETQIVVEEPVPRMQKNQPQE